MFHTSLFILINLKKPTDRRVSDYKYGIDSNFVSVFVLLDNHTIALIVIWSVGAFILTSERQVSSRLDTGIEPVQVRNYRAHTFWSTSNQWTK